MEPNFDVEMVRLWIFQYCLARCMASLLVFLDSGASAQKPPGCYKIVSAISTRSHDANVHRGAHYLSHRRSTDEYENARVTIAEFMNALLQEKNIIVFTSGVTESINLVAATWGRKFLGEGGDEVVISWKWNTTLNIVPWQLLREEKGIVLTVVPVCDDVFIRLEAFSVLLKF